MRPLLVAAVASLLATTAPVPAQAYGIMHGSPVGISRPIILCGFDCSAILNTTPVSRATGGTLDIYLVGDAGMPGVLAVGIGPALAACPGIPVPGIANSLLILPPNLILALGANPLGTSSVGCRAPGSGPALSALPIPPTASGATLTLQGLVFESGLPVFTRAFELSVR
jgi:hypothetical protein